VENELDDRTFLKIIGIGSAVALLFLWWGLTRFEDVGAGIAFRVALVFVAMLFGYFGAVRYLGDWLRLRDTWFIALALSSVCFWPILDIVANVHPALGSDGFFQIDVKPSWFGAWWAQVLLSTGVWVAGYYLQKGLDRIG
jgi:hypothetical protein